MRTAQHLYDRWFGPDDEEDQEIERSVESRQKEFATVRGFVNHPGYQKYLRKWLQDEIDNNEIGAGEHAHMLARVGFREGLIAVKKRLIELERIVSEET